MEQLDRVAETISNNSQESQPGESQVHQDLLPEVSSATNHDGWSGEEGCWFEEQVRGIQGRLRGLKTAILEPSESHHDPDEDMSQEPPHPLQQQIFDRQIISEIKNQRDSYVSRIQNLEERLERLLSSDLLGGNGNDPDVANQRSLFMVDPDLYYEIHREGGYLSQLEKETMRLRENDESTASETLAKLDAVKAEKVIVEADRDTLIEENEDLREKLKTMLLRYETLIRQRSSMQSDSGKLVKSIESSHHQNVHMTDYGHEDERAEKNEKEVPHANKHSGAKSGEICEAQLALARSERDAAIKQNEEARRTLATRTAERSGAHQRIRILEASLAESQERETLLRSEIRKRDSHQRARASMVSEGANPEEFEQTRFEFLRDELEHAVAAATKAQHERDAARIDIKVLEAENSIAHSAAETANDVVNELQVSLEAANNAALAEREKSEECRRTQNRLRVERETLRIEVSKLEKALDEAHQVSMGLVRHGNMTVGDLVHIQEEKDAALARLGTVQIELDKANGTTNELQMALDDCLARQSFHLADDLGLDELNRVTSQRDEALAHVRDLERLLEELEDDYRMNLDEWEWQTQKDEQEIFHFRNCLEEEKKRSAELSEQLKTANSKIQEAEVRAATAETRSTTLEIQIQQLGQDLDHSNEDREALEDTYERLREQCHAHANKIEALRNEVVRLGGKRVAPGGIVQGEDGWPHGPPSPVPDYANVSRPSPSKPRARPQDLDADRPGPDSKQSSASHRRQPRKASSVYDSSSSELSSAESDPSTPGESHLQWRPKPRPARPDSQPLLQTSPTMAAKIHPRSSRNPQPHYGASTRPRPVKRKADTDHENLGPAKKKRVTS